MFNLIKHVLKKSGLKILAANMNWRLDLTGFEIKIVDLAGFEIKMVGLRFWVFWT